MDLPRKHKITVSACPAQCDMPEINCIALIGVVRDGVNGFAIRVGGGLSTVPRLSRDLGVWIPVADAMPVLQALLDSWREDRRYRISRVKARMKFWVDDRLRVEELVVGDPRDRAAGDVPDGVAAGAGGGQPGRGELVQDRRHVRQVDEVDLDVLPRRELGRTLAEPHRDLADRPQRLGSQHARGDLDAEHERPDLGLVVVQPVPLQPDELLLGDVEVVRRGELGEVVQRVDRGAFELEALDRVALEDLVPRGLGPERTAFAASVLPVLRHLVHTSGSSPTKRKEPLGAARGVVFDLPDVGCYGRTVLPVPSGRHGTLGQQHMRLGIMAPTTP
jgi:hypothetical protein